MLTVWAVMAVFPSPLVPVPSEVKLITAEPLLAPAVLVLTPSARAVLLDCAASRLIEAPFVVALPVRVPKDASSFSEYEPAAAVFVTVRICVRPPPTRWLARVIGVVIVFAAA